MQLIEIQYVLMNEHPCDLSVEEQVYRMVDDAMQGSALMAGRRTVRNAHLVPAHLTAKLGQANIATADEHEGAL